MPHYVYHALCCTVSERHRWKNGVTSGGGARAEDEREEEKATHPVMAGYNNIIVVALDPIVGLLGSIVAMSRAALDATLPFL